MRRAALCLLALLILGVPTLCRADAMSESRTPDEYTQQDSHPLRFASYFVMPVGFLVEWTVMRPLHWLATSRFLAPALDSEHSGEAAPAPIAELPPPDLMPGIEAPAEPAPLREQSLNPPAAKAPTASSETQPSAPSPPSETSGQAILH